MMVLVRWLPNSKVTLLRVSSANMDLRLDNTGVIPLPAAMNR